MKIALIWVCKAGSLSDQAAGWKSEEKTIRRCIKKRKSATSAR